MSAVWLVGLALGFAGLVRLAWEDWQVREREKQEPQGLVEFERRTSSTAYHGLGKTK